MVFGALLGAALPIVTFLMFMFVDEDARMASVPQVIEVPITFLYILVALPGALFAGHGLLTGAFLCLFWAAMGAFIASRRAHKRDG